MQVECEGCRAIYVGEISAEEPLSCPHCGTPLSTNPAEPRDVATMATERISTNRAVAVNSGEETTQTYFEVATPEQIGPFVIERLLGGGGFAQVYLAQDEKLDRPVALKIPRPEMELGPVQVANFVAEARTAAKLNHPNIVQIYGVEQYDQGPCVIVMEYVEGQSLSVHHELRRREFGRMSFRETAEVLAQVADAVHYAHKRGLVHRDLKPGNILIDGTGRPRVADFGLAVSEEVQHLHEAEVAGTVPYMSPEQVRGEVPYLDGRCDVWSLGVTMYELLVGRRPFHGSGRKVRDEILHREPKPPRQIDDSVPLELEQICLRCLRKSVTDRTSTAGDVATALREWLASDKLASAPTVQTTSALRRPAVAVLIALSFLALALVGAVTMGWREQADFEWPGPPRYEHFRSVDARVPHKWHPILDRRPQALSWSHRNSTYARTFNPENESATMSNGPIALLGCGRTESRAYRLQVTISKTAPIGNGGLFYGGRPRVVDGKPGWQVQTVFLQLTNLSPPSVRRQVLQLDEDGDSIQTMSQGEFYEAGIPAPSTDEHVLQLDFLRGALNAIRWDGRLLPKLVEPDPALLEHTTIAPELMSRGVFGVVNYGGATTFRDLRFYNLEGPSDE